MHKLILEPVHSSIVLASAGSGKTTLLKNRYINLVKQGIDPEKILCLTYTNNAAHEMLVRIQHDLGQVLHKHKIATIHSYLAGIIRSFPEECGLKPDFEIVDDDLLRSIILNNIHYFQQFLSGKIITLENNIEDFVDLLIQIANLDVTVLELNEQFISSRIYTNIRKNLPDNYSETELEILNITLTNELNYIKAILDDFFLNYCEGRYITFTNIIATARKLLDDQDLRYWIMYKIDSGIQHLMLDEAQDITSHQIEVLEPIINNIIEDPDKSLFIVGDIKQSIYSFQGSNSDYFKMFLNNIETNLKIYHKSYAVEKLNNTYRSSIAVINHVNQVYSNHQKLAALKVDGDFTHTTFNNNQGGVFEYSIDAKSQKNEAISNKILDIIRAKSEQFLLSDIMILLRSRGVLFETIKSILRFNNIEYSSREKIVLQENEVFKDIINIFRYVYLQNDDFTKYRIQSLYGTIIESVKSDISYLNLLTVIYKHAPASPNIHSIVYNLVADKIYLTPVKMIEYLISASISVYTDANDFGVKIMTMHGAKGLESEIVILVDSGPASGVFNKFEYSYATKNLVYMPKNSLKSEIFQNISENKKLLEKEEKVRLEYVALTRAKQELHIIQTI